MRNEIAKCIAYILVITSLGVFAVTLLGILYFVVNLIFK
jgi:hypothetical protein